MTPEPAVSGPRSVFRSVVGPLVAYHVLVLAGAYFILLGFVGGSRNLELAGVGVVAAGILTELWVLRWSARLVRRAADRGAGERISTGQSSLYLPPKASLCVRCGAHESGVRRTCSRCGNPMVRV